MKIKNLPQKKSREKFVAEVDVLKGDDGDTFYADGHEYKWLDGATAIADLPNLVPAKAHAHVEQFGVSGLTNDGSATFTGDYSTEIQAAIDYLQSIGGGELRFPQGVFPISSTVYNGEGSGVTIRGCGRGSFGGNKTELLQSGSTRFHWTGAADGTMFELTSDRNNTGLNPRYTGGGFVDVMIDGAETAGYCLRVWSHAGNYIKIMTTFSRKVDFTSGVLSNDVKASSVPDNQRSLWNIHANSSLATTEPDALVWISGDHDVTANTSLMQIEELHLRPESTAVAAHLESMDSCFINYLHAATRNTASGDGGKVFLHADDTLPVAIGTAAGRHCRSNYFGFVQAKNGFVAKESTSTSFHSENNVIGMFSTENGGAATPTVETSATLYYITSDGVANLSNVTGDGGIDSGSGYIKYPDGTMICWGTASLTFNAATNLNGTFTYPQTFASAPIVTATLNSGMFSTTSTGLTEITSPTANSITTTSCNIRLHRTSGLNDFVSGDTATVNCIAHGTYS